VNVRDELATQLRPFVARDSNGHLAILLGAVQQMLQPFADLILDDPDTGAPGWSPLVDIDRLDRVPGDYLTNLAYLAQFVGVVLQAGLAADAQAQRVRSTDGFKRGSPSGIIGAAQQHLTGNKTVVLREKWNPDTAARDDYHAQIITYAPETPDPAQVADDVNRQDPGGIIFHFSVLDGQDWQSVKTQYPTWLAVRNAYGSWQAVRDDVPS
jgi:hypothetical protein